VCVDKNTSRKEPRNGRNPFVSDFVIVSEISGCHRLGMEHSLVSNLSAFYIPYELPTALSLMIALALSFLVSADCLSSHHNPFSHTFFNTPFRSSTALHILIIPALQNEKFTATIRVLSSRGCASSGLERTARNNPCSRSR
jgi:hypothetical protein